MAASTVGLILAGASTAAKMRGDEVKRREQRDLLNRSLQRTQEASDKSAKAVLDEGAQYDPAARQAAMDAEQASAFQRSQADLAAGGAGGDIVQTAGGDGANSAAFVKARADKAVSEGNRITDIAREMAKTRGTSNLLNAEGLRRADLSQRLGSAASTSRNLAQADQLDAQNVDTPWYGKAGAIGQAIGLAMLSGGASGGAAAGAGEGATIGAGAGDLAASGAPTALGYGAGYAAPAGMTAASGGGLSAAMRNAAAMWSGGRNNRVFGGG